MYAYPASLIETLKESSQAMPQSLLTNALTLIIGASLGFGTSQMFIVSDVTKSKNDIGYLIQADENIRREQISAHSILDSRISSLSNLVGDQIKLNQELVSLIKIQNELLTRDHK